MDITDLYQELIIDHGTKPRNYFKLADFSNNARGYNPLCGDEVNIYLKVSKDRITDISFIGHGCAISMASASLMTELIKDKTIAEAILLISKFHTMLTKENALDTKELGKLLALAGVTNFPSRVKCATLAWHTLKASLTEKHYDVSSE